MLTVGAKVETNRSAPVAPLERAGAHVTAPADGGLESTSAPRSPTRTNPRRIETEAPGTTHRRPIMQFIIDETRAIEARGFTRKPGNKSLARFHEGAPARGLVVFLHGFDAGTAVWDGTHQQAFDRGYDVFVPALPGHGLLKNGLEDTSAMPTAARADDWVGFVEQIFDLAREAGRVTVVGHSFGGMLALLMGARHARDREGGDGVIHQVVAVAPLVELVGDYKIANTIPLRLGRFGLRNQTVADAMKRLRQFAPRLVDGFLRTQTMDMRVKHPDLPYGARRVDQDIVLGLTIVADRMRARAHELKALPGGVQLIATACDDLVSPRAIENLGRRIGAEVHVFSAERNVVHAMMAPLENPDERSLAESRRIILDRLARPS